MAAARAESEAVLFACVAKVLARNGLKPTDVDALIVNCTAFNPTPSLSASVVNHFRMRKDVRTFSLHGMGCAASVIAVDLARDLLATHPGMRIVVAGTENILNNLYQGNTRSMLITNCIFRLGGVAYLLSNRRDDARRAKYVLGHLVRTHLGGEDDAFNAVIQREDDEGVLGVKIGKELMGVAGRALEANLSALGPKVLPLSEKLIFAGHWLAGRLAKARGGKVSEGGVLVFHFFSFFPFHHPPTHPLSHTFFSPTHPPTRPQATKHVPDFKRAFDHFAIHPGGKAVIDGVGKALGLSPAQCLPMLVPFERYGNTSSSSTWYAWAFIESEQGVRRGDRLWQLAFGSGFKCCSATWTALRDCGEAHDAWTETPTDAE
jgi:3-ketoacyl-CoA synthase